MVSGARIRSGYHRRILDWLADGGATVSEISEHLSLRMPHASLALRQLRESGDVIREDQSGIRGAKHRLSELGLERLESDALTRVQRYVKDIPADADGILLSREGSLVLLGFVKNPQSDLLHLPNVIGSKPNAGVVFSNGSEGGRWAIARGSGISWFDLKSRRATDAPQSASGTLVDWAGESAKIGIVRARLLDAHIPWQMVEGSWFKSPVGGDGLPAILRSGEFAIGTVSGHEVEIKPPLSLHAHLAMRVNRSMLASNLGNDARLLIESRSIKQREVPSSVLFYWLKNRHPRYDLKRLEKMSNSLTTYYTKNRGSSPSISLQRDLLSDFGNCKWVEDCDLIELSNISHKGAIAIFEWILDANGEFVAEWNWPIQGNEELLSRLLSSSRCRLLMTTKGEYSALESSSMQLFEDGRIANLRLQLDRGLNLDVKLSDTKTPDRVVDSRVPNNVIELDEYVRTSNAGVFSGKAGDSKDSAQLWKAIQLYPQGDSHFASRVERENPLAAWIACESKDRYHMWLRINDLLPTGFNDLLDVESMKVTELVEALGDASSSWQDQALKEIKSRLRANHELALEIEDSLETSAYSATALLYCADVLDDEFSQILANASSIWLDTPLRQQEVLESLFPIGKPLSDERQALRDKFIIAAAVHPRDSILYLWSQLVLRSINSEVIEFDSVRRCMDKLPATWWQSWSSEWLLMQLSNNSGREWLAKKPIPWLYLLAREQGEVCGLPGLILEHPGLNLQSESLLHIMLLPQGEGRPHLLDLYDSVRSLEMEETPRKGRTHPYSTLLAHPVSSWPNLDISVFESGDRQIAALLYARFYRSRIAKA